MRGTQPVQIERSGTSSPHCPELLAAGRGFESSPFVMDGVLGIAEELGYVGRADSMRFGQPRVRWPGGGRRRPKTASLDRHGADRSRNRSAPIGRIG